MEEFITRVFSTYAYQPWLVYGSICGFMFLSAFGLPIPEEVVLISAGFVGYMSLNPEQFPPPPGATDKVNVYWLAVIAFVAVMASDFLIYYLGRRFGPRLFKVRWFARMMPEKTLQKIRQWMWEYGSWTVIVFRFTPGVRFPGHLTCGAMGVSPWRFIAIDWIAAGLSVPTQVLLVSFYGKFILQYFTRFKIYFFSTLGAIVLLYFALKYLNRRKEAAAAAIPVTASEPMTAARSSPTDESSSDDFRPPRAQSRGP